MKEQSYSESRERRTGSTRKQIGQIISSSMAAELKRKEKEKHYRELIEEYGHGKHYEKGTVDRVNGKEYDPTLMEIQDDPKSYESGYFKRGERVLYGKFVEMTENEIEEIGRREAHLGIPKEYIQILLKHPSYFKGYSEILLESLFLNSQETEEKPKRR